MNVPGLHEPQYPSNAPPQAWRSPVVHVSQVLQLVAVVSSWNVFVAHASHDVARVVSLNVPGGHGSHSPAETGPHPTRRCPAGQTPHCSHRVSQ